MTPTLTAQQDATGYGSARLKQEQHERIQDNEKPKYRLSPSGSLVLNIVLGLLISLLYASVAVLAITISTDISNVSNQLSDFMWKWCLEAIFTVTVILLVARSNRKDVVVVEEGEDGFISFFKGWLLRYFMRHIRLAPGEHTKLVSFLTCYALQKDIRGFKFKVSGLACRGVKVSGKANNTTGTVDLQDLDCVAHLRVVDPLEMIERISSEAGGIAKWEATIIAFLDNIVRDGVSPMTYNEGERAENRDNAVMEQINERHPTLRYEMSDRDIVWIIPGTGCAVSSIMVQTFLAKDDGFLKSRLKPSIAVGENAALEIAHKGILAMAVKQAKEGIPTSGDPLVLAHAQTGEISLQGFLLGLNSNTADNVAKALQGSGKEVVSALKNSGKKPVPRRKK